MTKLHDLKELGMRVEEILANVFMFSLLTFPGAAIFASGFLGLFNYDSDWPDPAIWATGFFPFWVIAVAAVFLSGRMWFLVSCGFFITGTLFMLVTVQYQWTSLTPADVKDNALWGNAHVVLAYLFTFVSVPTALGLGIYAYHKMQRPAPAQSNEPEDGHSL